MLKVKVAEIVIEINIPEVFFWEDLYKFRCEDSERTDISIGMTQEKFPGFKDADGNSAPIHAVCSFGEVNYYVMSDVDDVTHFQFDNEYSGFLINVNENCNLEKPDLKENNYLMSSVNSALKRIFLMVVASKGGIMLHASTIKCHGGAVSFSAASGTGKTTHTNLWQDTISDVEVINGDNGYLFFRNGEAMFCSAPWSGTSGECKNENVLLRAVVFLEQAEENMIRKLEIPEAFMRFCTRCFMPAWDRKLFLQAISTVELLTGVTDCFLLKCLPDNDAARVCYDGIY